MFALRKLVNEMFGSGCGACFFCLHVDVVSVVEYYKPRARAFFTGHPIHFLSLNSLSVLVYIIVF
jgi:hypothetical protein